MQELHQLETVIALLAAVLALATAARRVLIPYPIFLVLGGLVIGVVPNVPTLRLDPDRLGQDVAVRVDAGVGTRVGQMEAGSA